MKNLIVLSLFIIACSFSTLTAQTAIAVNNPVEVTKKAAIAWDQTTYDFGSITQNVPAKATFKLTNNSDIPLLLKAVKPTCGCTVAAYDQDPILPGESTEISATYNAKKTGKFQKTIKVLTNLDEEQIPLRLKGEVVADSE